MKIRQGFVSNSSSSSFCIFGTIADKSFSAKKVATYIKKNIDKFKGVDVEEIDKSLEDEDDYLVYETFNEGSTGYTIETPDGGEVYVGRYFTSIRDDETGKQFKDSTREFLKELIGKNVKVDTYEETYYC